MTNHAMSLLIRQKNTLNLLFPLKLYDFIPWNFRV